MRHSAEDDILLILSIRSGVFLAKGNDSTAPARKSLLGDAYRVSAGGAIQPVRLHHRIPLSVTYLLLGGLVDS